MSDGPAIATRQLRKEYEDVIALRALDLEVRGGEIFGLIGPNGAGKSTLLKILATALRPDHGGAAVTGYDVEGAPREVRRRVGFMPDFFSMYENVTAEDFLTYFGLAFGLEPDKALERTRLLLKRVNLADKSGARVAELSRGMRQRLVFAKTIVHDPPVLLLDEPLSGLDPMARMEMRGILRGLREEGKTVVVSSHVLPELTDFCTSVGILEKGELLIAGSMAEVSAAAKGGRQVEIEVVGEPGRARDIISAAGGALAPGAGPRIRFTLEGARERIAEINAALTKAGIGVLAIEDKGSDLENIYFRLSSHEVQ